MTDTHDEHGNPNPESAPTAEVPTGSLLPPRLPAPPPIGGHHLRWVPADPETLAKVRAALRRL